MTSPPADDAERPDPVLVRPYVTTTPTQRDPAEAPTVIQPPVVDDTTELDPVPAAPPSRLRMRLGRVLALRMLALLGGLALALAVAAYLVFAPDDSTGQPSTALPTFAPDSPAAASSPHPSASASSSPSPSASSSASSSASPSASASPSLSASASPSATTAGPPSSDRTGAVTAASGRCLALGGLFAVDGSPVQVSACADVDYQHFTLATDGTLRVAGKCAEATGDATVRITGCGDEAAAQWRSGTTSSLVNQSTGKCLTDPGSLGATTKVTACTGASDQSWSLP